MAALTSRGLHPPYVLFSPAGGVRGAELRVATTLPFPRHVIVVAFIYWTRSVFPLHAAKPRRMGLNPSYLIRDFTLAAVSSAVIPNSL